MRLGIFSNTATTGTIDQVIAEARRAEVDGFDSFWVPQIFGYDALTLLALVGSEVPRIELGTSVVPTYRDRKHDGYEFRQAGSAPARVPVGADAHGAW